MPGKSYLKALSFIVTNDCGQACVYCIQRRGREMISEAIVDRSLDLFYGNLLPESYVSFYGGEPLLAFDRIQYVTRNISQRNLEPAKNISYALTTCGEQLTLEMMDFFNSHGFMLKLSFDGYRAKWDPVYKDGLFERIRTIQEHTAIQLSINLVSGPDNVHLLTTHIRSLVEAGIEEITFSFDIRPVWDQVGLEAADQELAYLVKYLFSHWRDTGTYPVGVFKPKDPALLRCSGARDRLAISPTGEIWGCYLFHDFFYKYPDHPDYQKYSLGNIHEFRLDNARHYDQLRQYYFAAGDIFCVNCGLIGECSVCPVTAALITNQIGCIPEYRCQIEGLKIKHRRIFQDLMGNNAGNVKG